MYCVVVFNVVDVIVCFNVRLCVVYMQLIGCMFVFSLTCLMCLCFVLFLHACLKQIRRPQLRMSARGITRANHGPIVVNVM